jgi:cell cycle arrest protein BUB3
VIHLISADTHHRSYHTFASAGSDGLVSIWDHTAKKRLRQYPKYHNAVNAVAFNQTGTKLAVGVSYGWDKGAEGARLPESSRVSIYVRDVGDEVKVCTARFLLGVTF